jgi:hypothetical protein
MSVFKDYKPDTDVIICLYLQDLLEKCFEFDWNCMKKPKFKDNEENIKEALRKNYQSMYPYSLKFKKRSI